MQQNEPSKQLPTKGIYYAAESYAGFWLRIFAWAIDLLFLSILVVGYIIIFINYSEWSISEFNILFGVSFITCHLYLTVVKTSEKSTLGFRVTNIKIVDLQGRKPSFFKMTFRFLLLTIGPFELVTDLLWLTTEKTKQTLRDKFVGTYVVKKPAQPVGEAPIVETRLFVLGWNLMYREVVQPEEITNKKMK